MILTMKVKLHVWSCTIEMEDSSTLEDLHYVIQQAVEFNDDHLYEFYLATSERSRDKDVIASYEYADEITLESIFPIPSGKKLFYLFDFGDDWLFHVSLTRKAPFRAKSGVNYPRLIDESGERPEQYPDWDE